MGGRAAIHTVAIFDSSDDTVAMLKLLLSERGYRIVSGRATDVQSGEVDFIEFLTTHRPAAIIWDIIPPYDRNWHFFKLIRELRPLDHCASVVTTTNKAQLEALAGQKGDAIEIVAKPYDVELILDAVSRGIQCRMAVKPSNSVASP